MPRYPLNAFVCQLKCKLNNHQLQQINEYKFVSWMKFVTVYKIFKIFVHEIYPSKIRYGLSSCNIVHFKLDTKASNWWETFSRCNYGVCVLSVGWW